MKVLEEPKWLLENREEGRSAYEKLPVPPPPSRERDFPIFYPADLSRLTAATTAPRFESTRKQAILLPLTQALETYETQVKTYLGKIARGDKNKWVALNQAFWQNGVFAYVPKNSDAGLIIIEHDQPATSPFLFPRNLIVVENGSRVNILDIYHSKTQQEAFAAPVIEIAAGENSEVHYAQIQEWGPETHHFSTLKINAAGHSQVTVTTCMFGGKRTVNHIQAGLQGEGSRAQLFGLVLGSDEQVFEHYTLQEHKAPQTESDLLFKVALKDKAYSHFDGLIWIEKGAKKTNAYQQNRNLLLSDHAKADSTPRLEILDNDVRCTHGVAVGPVDEEQRFYLESRGVPPKQAEGLIVEGFFEQVLLRLPDELLKQRLQQKLSILLNTTVIPDPAPRGRSAGDEESAF